MNQNQNLVELENDDKTKSSFSLICGIFGTVFSLMSITLGIICIVNHCLSVSFALCSLLTLVLGIVGFVLAIKPLDKNKENDLTKNILSKSGFVFSIIASTVGGLNFFLFTVFYFFMNIFGGIIIYI